MLFRINAQSEVYEQALADRGVPYVVRGVERFFDRPEVRQSVLLLRGAARAGDPGRGEAADPLARSVTGSARRCARCSPATAGRSRPRPGPGRAREQWESLAALAALAEEHERAHPDAGLAEFVRELEERAAVQHAPVVDGVTLASLHSAKGLEWDAVHRRRAHRGPAADHLRGDRTSRSRRSAGCCTSASPGPANGSRCPGRWPGHRAGGPRAAPRASSTTLREAKAAMTDAGAGGVVRRGSGRGPQEQGKSKRSGPVRCRVCGKALIEPVDRKLGRCADCPSDLDQALFQQLRDWRSAQAQQQSLPAYVVFTDATLTAIAEIRPQDRAGLSRISGVGAAKLEPVRGAVARDPGRAHVSEAASGADSGAPAPGEESQEPPDSQQPPWPGEDGA